MTQLNNRK